MSGDIERFDEWPGGDANIDTGSVVRALAGARQRIAELEAAAHDVSAILHMLSTWVISEDVLAEIEKARRRLMNADQ